MKVAIITEGFQGTGYGHLTRCLSIYQAFEEKNIVPLFVANCDERGQKFIPNVNLLQLDWLNQTDDLYDLISGFDVAIVDSYLAPVKIYEKIQKIVAKAVYIDDYIRLDYPPGIIINGTIGAENLPYKKDELHKYLLGIEFMPLRKEFWQVKPCKKPDKISNILLTFGGQDSRGLTFPILDLLLKNYPKLNFYVINGNDQIEAVIEHHYPPNVRFYNSLNAKEMLNVMLNCDLAITAAGQTIYELIQTGLKIIAIGIAENQRFNIKMLKKNKIISKELWYYDKLLFEKVCSSLNFYLGFMDNPLLRNNNELYLSNWQGARNIMEELSKKDVFEIKKYWDERASFGFNAGTNDSILKKIEISKLKEYVKTGMKILDLGCGNGVTAIDIASNYDVSISAYDYAPKMVEQAMINKKNAKLKGTINFELGDIKDVDKIKETYDLIYTERVLINLSNWIEQMNSIKAIIKLLKSKGIYLMCENSQDALDRLNEFRLKANLEKIIPPWHNRYFLEKEIKKISINDAKLIKVEPFTSTYYFVSRIINAWESKSSNKNPEYDAPINNLASLLPSIGDIGQTKLWIWEKD